MQPPPIIGSHIVVAYALIDERHQPYVACERIATGLAVVDCEDGSFFTFYCDSGWNVLADDWHQSLEEAMSSHECLVEARESWTILQQSLTAFTLDLDFAGKGSLNATAASDEISTAMAVSYISDAVCDLVEAAVQLIGPYYSGPIICSWQDEPGEYRWILARDDFMVDVEIRRFDETHSKHEDKDGERVFKARCSVTRFVAVVDLAVRRLVYRHGAKGYGSAWAHPYPNAGLSRLTERLVALNRSRIADG